ncbi:MAG: hypothetical protein WB677_02150 [Xanthobacteraceae bacterium]
MLNIDGLLLVFAHARLVEMARCRTSSIWDLVDVAFGITTMAMDVANGFQYARILTADNFRLRSKEPERVLLSE